MTRRRSLALSLLLLCGICSIRMEAGSRISISKMGGDIDVEDAPFGASLHTMGGDIHIGRASGEVVAKTMGGNIDVRELAGQLDAGSMGGNIRVRVVGSGGGHDLRLQTMGGAVDLVVPRDFDASFSIEIKDSEKDRPSRIESDIPLTRTVTEHWTLFHGTQQTIHASKAASTQANRVEILTYASRVTIRRQ